MQISFPHQIIHSQNHFFPNISLLKSTTFQHAYGGLLKLTQSFKMRHPKYCISHSLQPFSSQRVETGMSTTKIIQHKSQNCLKRKKKKKKKHSAKHHCHPSDRKGELLKTGKQTDAWHASLALLPHSHRTDNLHIINCQVHFLIKPCQAHLTQTPIFAATLDVPRKAGFC